MNPITTAMERLRSNRYTPDSCGYEARQADLDTIEQGLGRQPPAEARKGNTPITELIADYESNGCDHSDMAWVRRAALHYVDTMADSQVRCLLYVLASAPAEAQAVAKLVNRVDSDGGKTTTIGRMLTKGWMSSRTTCTGTSDRLPAPPCATTTRERTMDDNVTPIRPTIGMGRMEQLRRFVEWEREHEPDKVHIAEWALHEIEALRADAERYRWLADNRCDVTMCASATDYGDGDTTFGPRVEIDPEQFGPEYGSPKAKLDAAIDAAREARNG